MNVERARALWKKALPFAFAAVALGTAGTAVAKRYADGDSCCKPGASCCHPGSPCCHHADKDRVSAR